MKKFLSLSMAAVLFLSCIPCTYANADDCNHEWTEWTVGKQATCGEDGYEERECKLCYKEEEKKIPSTGNHNFVLDKSLSDEPTCEKDGMNWYECTVCDDYKKEVIPATGEHKWSEWKSDGYLCEDGKYTRHCEWCEKEEVKERKGDGSHVWTEWEVYEKPDCLNEGKEERKCLNCYEYEYRAIPVDKSNHIWSEWTSIKGATALSKGIAERECYICKTTEQKEIPKLKAVLKLSVNRKNIKVGKTFKIVIKEYAKGDKVSSYSSNNKKVATVDKKGKVSAKKKGTANITVKMKSGCKAVLKVTVK